MKRIIWYYAGGDLIKHILDPKAFREAVGCCTAKDGHWRVDLKADEADEAIIAISTQHINCPRACQARYRWGTPVGFWVGARSEATFS
jgi:hypothetical protein